MKRRHFFGIGMIALFIAFSIGTFSSSLTPYVSFAQAKSLHNNIQIRGMLVPDSITYIEKGKVLTFKLRDDSGEQVGVLYHGIRPDGFAQASSVVAIGTYQDGQFHATKILVKCPSKYQGVQGSVSKL